MVFHKENIKVMEPETSALPTTLTRILNASRTHGYSANSTYESFLLVAERAKFDCEKSNMLIRGSYKLADAPPGNLNPAGEVDTLILVFQFYAKIRAAYAATFGAAEGASKTMTFSKLEIFCRDFQIVPRLLTRDEVKMLWEDIAKEHIGKGKGIFTVIDFDQFKDMIVRMALLAYHKPGLKKLIITLDGFMPRNVEVVNYFTTYLHFNDPDYIHNFLRTVGRKTQGDLNFRSKGEINYRTKLEVRADADVKKLSQIKASVRPSTSSNSSSSTKRGLNAFGEKERPLNLYRGAVPGEVIRQQRVGESESNEILRGSLLPPEMLERLTVKAVSFTNEGDGLHRSTGASRLPSSPKEATQKLSSTSVSVTSHSQSHSHSTLFGGLPTPIKTYHFDPSQFTGVQEDNDDSDEDDAESYASSHNLQHSNSVNTLRCNYLADYDKALHYELKRFCYVAPRVIVTDWIETLGPLADLGLLEQRSKVVLMMQISNGSMDEVHIDAITRDFGSDDCDLKTYSKPLIPGLVRDVTVTFTVPERNCTVLAYVDIYSVSVRTGECSVVSCPVFYRVDSNEIRDLFPKCTLGSLPDLVGTRIEGRTRQFTPSFEKTKLNNTWASTGTSSRRLGVSSR